MADAKREDRPDCDVLQEELRQIVRLQRRVKRAKRAAQKVCMGDVAALVGAAMPPAGGKSRPIRADRGSDSSLGG